MNEYFTVGHMVLLPYIHMFKFSNLGVKRFIQADMYSGTEELYTDVVCMPSAIVGRYTCML